MTDLSTAQGAARQVRAADVSVVVCTYSLERWHDLESAVGSLIGQQEPVGEIIVVVDHNDGLLARCRATWPGITVIPNVRQRGLSGARDTGAQASNGQVVAFLDDDAAAAPDWSARLAAAYDDQVIGAGGAIEPAWPATGRPSWFPDCLDWVVGCTYRGMPEERRAVRNVIGANMSVRRDVLLGVGGFDARIGRIGTSTGGCEETEMYIRAAAANPGGSVVYEPAARVRHRVGAERATWRYLRGRCYGEGRSKAVVAGLSGADAALSSERSYVTRTLPLAFLRGLFSRDPRAGVAVLLALAWTTAGFLRGRLDGRPELDGRPRPDARPRREPARVVFALAGAGATAFALLVIVLLSYSAHHHHLGLR